MKAPTITETDVAAVDHSLQLAEQLEEYARHTPGTSLDEQKMKQTVAVLQGLHSVLALVHVHQKRTRQNHSLEAFADG